MKLLESFELAKLEDWQLVGDEDNPFVPKPVRGESPRYRARTQSRGHSEQDLNLLRKRKAELTKVLDRVPWKFRFYFFIQPVLKKRKGTRPRLGNRGKTYFPSELDGILTTAQARKAFKDYGEPFPGDGREAINVIHAGVTFSSKGYASPQVPPTPWMILHRVAHPIVSLGQYWDAFGKWLGVVYGLYEPDEDVEYIVEDNKIIERLFNFRSARKRTLLNSTEGIHEIFVDFIFNKGQLNKMNPGYPEKVRDWETWYRKESPMRGRVTLREDLEAAVTNDLNRAVGKWYYV